MFLSAHTRRGVTQMLGKVTQIQEIRTCRVGTSELNRVVEHVVAYNPPPSGPSGRPVKLFYCTQASVAPPTFVFFANYPDAVTEPYRRYLSNQLRETFGFLGTPIRVLIRGRGGKADPAPAEQRKRRRTG
jgi:GTP-binding protein